jgi:group I intron endonuclease
MPAGVYEILDTQTNMRYVGSSKNVRLRLNYHRTNLGRGTHYNPHLQRAYALRREVFVFRPLAYLEDCEVLPTEQRLLRLEHSNQIGTYNLAKDATAPMKGRKHSPEWLAKSALWRAGNKSRTGQPSNLKGIPLTEEHKRKMKESKAVVSPETREKMRLAKIGYVPWNKGNRQKVCKRGHEMTESNTYNPPNKNRPTCKMCSAINTAKYILKKKELQSAPKY